MTSYKYLFIVSNLAILRNPTLLWTQFKEFRKSNSRELYRCIVKMSDYMYYKRVLRDINKFITAIFSLEMFRLVVSCSILSIYIYI